MSEYIKKADMERILNSTSNAIRIGKSFLELPTYSFPDSAENKGEWIYDKGIHNWRCSRCGQTPPPTGYVGKADFMAKHFKFCPTCGADMREPKGEKGQPYGWEEGRKALCDEITAEIKSVEYHMIDCEVLVSQEEVLDIIEKHKAESEDKE